MNKQTEALKMAIAQFERINNEYPCEEIIDICKEALEQEKQPQQITKEYWDNFKEL